MNRFLNANPRTREGAKPTNSKGTKRFDNRFSKQRFERPTQTNKGGIVSGAFRRILRQCGNPAIRFILPGGEEIIPNAIETIGTIIIHDNRTIWSLALDPLFQFGEAFADGRLEIEGDTAEVLTILYGTMTRNKSFESPGRRILTRLRRPTPNSLRGSQQNIHHHYDIGNEFYRLWLDRQMVYTCAYFSKPSLTLEEAQTAKLDHVCRKLGLRPGMQVAEAGCGWGALAMHMAKRYGTRVKAFNISDEQLDWARKLAAQQGLTGQVEFVCDDWRNIRGQFDAFVSVGMLEHVGLANYQQLGSKIRECLKPDGIGLVHSIGQNSPAPLNPWIERRIFPGAYPPSLTEMLSIFEPNGFSVLDVENLRLHYAETLRHWLQRFEDSIDKISENFDERFIRMWRLYLAGSVATFSIGYLQLFQVVFANGTSNHLPRTREHLYGVSPACRWDDGKNGHLKPLPEKNEIENS